MPVPWQYGYGQTQKNVPSYLTLSRFILHCVKNGCVNRIQAVKLEVQSLSNHNIYWWRMLTICGHFSLWLFFYNWCDLQNTCHLECSEIWEYICYIHNQGSAWFPQLFSVVNLYSNFKTLTVYRLIFCGVVSEDLSASLKITAQNKSCYKSAKFHYSNLKIF